MNAVTSSPNTPRAGLSFDPAAPLEVPPTHRLHTVVWRGTDDVAHQYVRRAEDDVNDGPFVEHGRPGKLRRVGTYEAGVLGPVVHVYGDWSGELDAVWHRQEDGSYEVVDPRGRRLGMRVAHPRTGEWVQHGWWFDIEGRDRLYELGIECSSFRTALPLLAKQLASGGIAVAMRGTNTGNLMWGLLGLMDAGQYSPSLVDAEAVLDHHVGVADWEVFARVFGGLGAPLVDLLQTGERQPSVVAVYPHLGLELPLSADPLLAEALEREPLEPLVRTLPAARREALVLTVSAYYRWKLLGLAPTRAVLSSMEERIDGVRDEAADAFAGLADVAIADGPLFVSWAQDHLGGAGKKGKRRDLVLWALGETGEASAVPLLVTGAMDSSAQARFAARQALKSLAAVAESGLEEASRTGSAKRKAVAAALLREHRRRAAAAPPEAALALDRAITASVDRGRYEALLDHPDAPLERTDDATVAMSALLAGHHPHNRWFYWISQGRRFDGEVSDALRAWNAVRRSRHASWNLQHHLSECRDAPELTAWYLDQLSSDPVPFVKGVLESGDPWEQRAILLQGLSLTNKKVRRQVVQSLSTLGERVIPEVVPWLEGDGDAQHAAAATLAAIGHPSAAPGLQGALALAVDKKVRTALEEALAACGGGETAGASDDTEDWEALLTAGRKPRLPRWLDPSALPSLRMAEGTTLTEEALLGLVGRLKKEHERPDPDLWRLRPNLEPESAHQLGRALYNAWLAARLPASAKWCVYQAALLCDQRFPHRLGSDLDSLASDGRHAMAGWLLEAFDRMPGVAGLSWVAHWADHGMARSVRERAQALFDNAARRRGVDAMTLRRELDPFVAATAYEDELLPTLGFDASGRKTEDGIELHLATGLQLVVDTKGVRSMPGSARVIQAAERGVSLARSRLLELLEEAMVGGRVWDAERFTRLADNPLFRSLIEGLVFRFEEAEVVAGPSAFQTAEGVDVLVPAQGSVRLLHPLEVDRLDRWSHLEGQPLEQIGRATFPVHPALELPDTPVPPTRALDRLHEGGWGRGSVEDAGWYYSSRIRLPSRGLAWVELRHGGIQVSDPRFGDPVAAESVALVGLDGSPCEPGDLDSVAFSEVQRAIYAVFPPPSGATPPRA